MGSRVLRRGNGTFGEIRNRDFNRMIVSNITMRCPDDAFGLEDIVSFVKKVPSLKGLTARPYRYGVRRTEDWNCKLAKRLEEEGFRRIWCKAPPGLPFDNVDE